MAAATPRNRVASVISNTRICARERIRACVGQQWSATVGLRANSRVRARVEALRTSLRLYRWLVELVAANGARVCGGREERFSWETRSSIRVQSRTGRCIARAPGGREGAMRRGLCREREKRALHRGVRTHRCRCPTTKR
jgi:hypothetical protein